MSVLRNKVKIIPIEQPFLRVLAHYIADKFKNDSPNFSNILLIFPSQRNKFYFRRYLLEVSGSKGIIPPTMKTIGEFMQDIYESVGGKRGMLLNRIERNFILKQVIDSLKIEFWRDLSFMKFISVGNRLLGFFDELSKERVTLDEIEAKVISGHYPEKYVKDELPIIKRIHNKYRETLAEQGYQDDILKYNSIFTQFDYKTLGNYSYICIAGLVATTSVENRIIKEILENLFAELIIHSAAKDIMKMQDTGSPFYLHFKLLKALGIEASDDLDVIDGVKIHSTVCHIRKTETESQQAFYINRLLKKVKTIYDPHRIAIILTDESMVYSVIETLRACGFEYNVSAGFPFSQSILYSFLNQLKLVIESKFHYEEFFAFIKHPLFKNAVVESKELRPLIYRLENYMVTVKLNFFDPVARYEDDFKPLIILIRKCVDAITCDLPLDKYIDKIIEMLNTFLVYNQEFIKTGSRSINDFFDQIHNLSRLRIREMSIGGGVEMLNFILRILKDATYNLRGEPMKGVQVIGFLEARNLDFDCIILSSMNEGIFPKRSEKDLFINQRVRREIGLPYDKERENLYHYYFTEMTKGKKEVFISYLQEEKRDIRSRFIDFLSEQGVAVDESKTRLEDTAIRIVKRGVEKDPNTMAYLFNMAAGKGLSPTSLKDFRECPYRFYLKYILNIREPNEIVEEAGPLEWGRIIHQSLNNFYRYDYPGGIHESDMEKAKEALYKRLDDAVKSELAQRPKGLTFLDLTLYKKRMSRFLQHEIQRFKAGFTIDRERLEKRVVYGMNLGNRQVNLHGYIDRVDIIDSKYYILDYKSSMPARNKYQIGEDFTEFQLPLYGLAVSKEKFESVAGLAYYILSNKVEIKALVEEIEVVNYLKDFKEQILIPTIKDLLDASTDFYQTEDKDACTFCSYVDLCGVKNV